MNTILNRHGYTFVEVFVAMMVFAFGVLALYRLQIASVQNNTYANEMTRATNLAEEKMQVLIRSSTAPSDSDSDGLNGLDDITTGSADGNESADNGKYTIFWNVAYDEPITDCMRIKVIVCWSDPRKPNDGCANSVSLDSSRAE